MNMTLHIYTRVSTESQDRNGHSLEYQKELGIKKATELGMHYEVHDEGSRSAATPDLSQRPVLSNLMARVKAGEAKHIFVYEFVRLSRDPVLSTVLNADIKASNVTVYLQTGQYDLSAPIDEMVSSILSSVSRYERQIIVNRSKLGLRKAYEKGKLTGQTPPYGYRRDSQGFLAIDNKEAKIYERMVRWTLDGESEFNNPNHHMTANSKEGG